MLYALILSLLLAGTTPEDIVDQAWQRQEGPVMGYEMDHYEKCQVMTYDALSHAEQDACEIIYQSNP